METTLTSEYLYPDSLNVSTLPIRNGNEPSGNLISERACPIVSTLPIRNGNTHCLIIGKVKRISEYLTYKEWKPCPFDCFPICLEGE